MYLQFRIWNSKLERFLLLADILIVYLCYYAWWSTQSCPLLGNLFVTVSVHCLLYDLGEKSGRKPSRGENPLMCRTVSIKSLVAAFSGPVCLTLSPSHLLTSLYPLNLPASYTVYSVSVYCFYYRSRTRHIGNPRRRSLL